MDELIPIANQLRDALAAAESDLAVELPHIAVVGGQSAGKSSLLEALVGRAFLPTGSGVVTRRPLVLRLKNLRSGAEFAEFQHLPGKRFDDFDAIRAEIQRVTARLCGSNQGISHEPIILQISSPRVVDLTLIDLPGMTRVPVGDQPPDIEAKIRALVLSYVTKPSCLILAVVPGNADLATSDALAMAREVDPRGERTIGVVTKLDLVETGTDCLAILEGRVYPLRLGFVGVVCRSFAEVRDCRPLAEMAEVEATFFQRHYRTIASRCGSAYLARHLNGILMDHIRSALPDMKNQVVERARELEIELEGYGESISLQRGDQGSILLGIFQKFSHRFAEVIDGKISGRKELQPGELVGRSRIDYIFRDVFAKTLHEFDSCRGLTDDEIRVAIRNATGPRATLFVPEAAFELLVRKQISRLQAPSLQCAELVFEELQQVLLLSALPEFKRFVNLRDQVFGVVREVLKDCLEPTLKMIKDLVAIELAYINTSHPDFVGGTGLRDAFASRERAGNQPSMDNRSTRQLQVSGTPGGCGGAGGAAPAVTPRKDAAGGNGAETPAVQATSATLGTASGGGGFFGFFRPRQSIGGEATAPEATATTQPGAAAAPNSVAAQSGGARAPALVGSGSSAAATIRGRSPQGGGGAIARGASESWGGKWMCGATPVAADFQVSSPSLAEGSASVLSRAASDGRLGGAMCLGTAAAEDAAFGSGAAFRGAFAGGAIAGCGALGQTGSLGASIGGTGGLKLPHVPPVITPASSAPSQRERVEVSIIKMLLESYLAIVKKNIADSVPKVVMHYMVNALKDVINSKCVAKLYQESKYEELLQEAHDIQSRRVRCKERLEALRRALEVIAGVGDLADGW